MIEINKVYQTSNYKLFNILEGNRKVDSSNYNKLKDKVGECGQLNPIIVNERYGVVDGQHRLAVCQSLKIPVNFIIHQGAGLKEVQNMNSTGKKWGVADFISSGVISGDNDYKILQQYVRKYHFVGKSLVISILGGAGAYSYTESDKVKTKTFKIIDIKEADRKLNQLKDIYEILSYLGQKGANAFLKHFYNNKNYNHERMIDQLNKYVDDLCSKETIGGLTNNNFLEMFTLVYNHLQKDHFNFSKVSHNVRKSGNKNKKTFQKSIHSKLLETTK